MQNVESSEYNRDPAVRKEFSFADDVYIVDSTIRSFQSGVSGSKHTAEDLVAIGKALDGLGVRELIVNLSWKDGFEVCEGLAQEDLSCKLVGTFRARHPLWAEWTERGLDVGVDEICYESAPDVEYLKRAADIVRQKDRKLSHAFAETYSYGEVVDLCRAGLECGCESQNFHDSFFKFGIIPEAMKFFIRSVRADVSDSLPLYVHLSNFYGHSTMTAVAAVVAGANALDVCMNAVGHHCGHISLAEVVMALEGLYGVDTGIDLGKINAVSRLIAERTGVPVPGNKPVVGDFAFLTDGAYWAAEADIPYEERVHAKFPFPPASVGAQERVIWSEKTATQECVATRLESLELENSDEHVHEILQRLEDVLAAREGYPNWISDAEFEALCRNVVLGE